MSNETNRPKWVKLALWGVPNRIAAWLCFWFTLQIVVSLIIYSFWEPLFLISIIFIIGPIWYYLAIKWVDKKGKW